MGYLPYVLSDFGDGLNLRSKADAVGPGEAIDLMNVIFTDRGAVQGRDGSLPLTAALTNAVGSLSPFYTTGGTKQLLAGCGSRLEALSTSGTVVASATGLTTGTWGFARFGQPNAEVAYAGNGQNLLRKWDGTSWSSIANSPKGGALAVTPTSNRLIASRFLTTNGGPSAGLSSPSHVYFSNAGDPETWSANDYVQLTPGDGEQIQAVVPWREYVFVFKESKFFVFTAESTGTDGGAIFNYRIVNTGIGLVGPKAVVSTEEGVFFCDRKGVYVTTGGEPASVSDPVEPIFTGGSASYFTGGELAHSKIADIAMGTHKNRIFLAYSHDGLTNKRVLVYDYNDGWWSLWNLEASCFCQFRPSNDEELMFGLTSANKVNRHSPTYTSDDSVVIDSYWRGGFQDFEVPENKKIRQSKVWGAGIVGVGISKDYEDGAGSIVSLNFSESVSTEWDGSTWGGGEWERLNVLVPRLRRNAIRGTMFSTYLQSNTLDTPWAVHRIEHHLQGVRQPSIRKTENV